MFTHFLGGISPKRHSTRGKRLEPKARRKLRPRLWLEPLEERVLLNAVVWDGLGADNNWSTSANWVGNTVPGPGDIATFNGTSLKNSTIDVPFSVAGIKMIQPYGGVITQASGAALTVGLSDYRQDAGTVIGGDSPIHVIGSFILSAGRFGPVSSPLTISGNQTMIGGSFAASRTTVTFDGNSDQAVDFGGNQMLGSVAVNKAGGILTFTSGFKAKTLSIGAGDTVKFQVTNTFALTNLTVNGMAGSPVTLDSTEPWTAWHLKVSPAGTQSIHYVQVRNSDAAGGAIINAADNGTDDGLNVNWDFGTAPSLVYATATSGDLTKVYVRYSEAMDAATATAITNYTLSAGLTVLAASISGDKKLVTLTASGNVNPGTTTMTASRAIKSLVRRNLPITTQTIAAGNTNGIPDSVGAIGLSLSTDDNQSVILRSRQQFTLTVTAPGTAPTTVGIGQIDEPGGKSLVYMGATPAAVTSLTVTTSGGAINTATVLLRGAITGAFRNDFTLRAYIGNGERGVKFATVIQFSFSPVDYYLVDQRPLTQTLTVTPIISGLQIVSETFASIHFPDGSHLENPTSLLAEPQLPLTDANGKASRTLLPRIEATTLEISNLVKTNKPQEDAPLVTNDAPNGPSSIKPIAPLGDKPNPTPPLCEGCQRSIDPSDGEKKLEITDLAINGRGINYEFQRAYRSFDYRRITQAPLDSFGANWSYSYADDRLVMDGTHPDTAFYIDYHAEGDQWADVFLNSAPDEWVSGSQSIFVQLRKNPTTGDLEIREQSGMVHVYYGFADPSLPNGRLKEIRDRDGNRMTFHYESIDPNGNPGDGDEKFVLAYLIDTLGREIRYQYYAVTDQVINGRPVTVASGNTAAWGRLATVKDFKGDMDFSGNNVSQDFPGQVNNRTLTFDYDEEGNLVRASSTAVGGTPNGNDFPAGTTYRYQYITNANRGGLTADQWAALTPDEQARLLHKLTHIWNPDEVKDAVGTNPPDTAAVEAITYETDPTNAFFGFATARLLGGTNDNGVPAGGTITYTYTDLNPGRSAPGPASVRPSILYAIQTLQVDEVDRDSNHRQYIYGGGRTVLQQLEFTRGFRAQEPTDYLTQNQYQNDLFVDKRTDPQGNQVQNVYNENSPDRFEQGNLIRTIRTPDLARGGDQAKIEQVFVYEPIYNQLFLSVQARGADMDHNGFTPPIPDPASRTIVDPYDPTKRLNLRYATINYFDYQESTEKASQAPDSRLDIDGSGGRVNQSPLIAVDPNVLTTEVWLVQESGLPENASGLTELRNRLSANLIRLGLGDLNGDGDTTPTIHGDVIRTVVGSPVLFTDSNQNAVETAIKSAGDLVNHMLSFLDGGTQEGPQPNLLQTIVTMMQYNQFGQLMKKISPEGNVTSYQYFPENDPDGDGILTPPPADARSLDATTGGYLEAVVSDDTRSYVPQGAITPVTGTFSDSNTDPTPTHITNRYSYDDVGNVITMTNGRGIRTDYFVNEHDQVVQVTKAADISGAATANPTDPLYNDPDPNKRLTAFQYLNRTFFDYNGNVVLSQIEDRGNTSGVDGNGLGTIPSQAVATTPGLDATNGGDPAGDPAFADTLNLYDRINDRIETRVEVDSTHSLNTRYRYDGNQHLVLTILPEGNAQTAIYDERDLILETSRGEILPPVAALLAPADPTNYDVRGGIDCNCTTYNYDLNGNVIETVDAADEDGSSANNSKIAGPGDRTRYVYDGFDRRTSIIDSVGNQTVYQYDPDGNVVRVSRFGPVGGPSPTSDGPDTLFTPVSSLGVIQTANLVNSDLLEATETLYDELSRVIQTERVLFVNAISTMRPPDVAEGATDIGLGALTPGLTGLIPGVTGVNILGRVSDRIEYDRSSRATFTVKDDLNTSRRFYDGANRVIETVDPERNTVETAYDDNNNVLETRETDVAQVAGVPNEIFLTTNFYDSLDRLQRRVDNVGQSLDYRYDSRNNLVAIADASGPVTGASITRRSFTGGVLTVNNINDYGNVTLYFYDGISRKTREEVVLTASGQGDGIHIGADLFGVRTTTPTPDSAQGGGDGIIRTGYLYDDDSLLSAVLDDQGNITLYLYDNLNRHVTETKGLTVNTAPLNKARILGMREVMTPTVPTINNPAVIPTDQIDAQLAEAKARIDTVFALFPSLADRVDDHPPTTIIYGYDQNDRLLIRQDENGSEVFTKYDAIDRPIAVRIFRAIQNDSFTGDVIFAPAPVSIILNLSQDDEPSPTVVEGTNRQNFQYDGLSRMSLASDNNNPADASDDSTVTDAYDSVNRIIEETQQIGSLAVKAIDSAWRAENLRKSLTYPNDRVELYSYDHLDRLATVSDQGANQNIAVYKFVGVDRLLERDYPINGTRETYLDDAGTADIGYDGLRRPNVERTLRTDNSLIVGFTYTYDRMNNKLTEGKLHDPANSESYGYDSSYRLISFSRAPAGITSFQSTWTLDGVGNWKSLSNETQQHSSLNEITQRTVNDNAISIISDDNGNEIDDGTFLYTWDAMNRLRTAIRKSDCAIIAAYSYDAANRRIRKVVTSSGALDGTTDFYLNGWQEIEERNFADALAQQYVYALYVDEPLVLDRNLNADDLAVGPGDQRLFYHRNTLNSIYAVTDTAGNILEGYQYDAYGLQTVYRPGFNGIVDFGADDVVIRDGTSAVNNPYMFTARRFDENTHLYYYRMRYFQSIIGRFLQRDPDGYVNGMNLYEYARSSPTYFMDPMGATTCYGGSWRPYDTNPAFNQSIKERTDLWLFSGGITISPEASIQVCDSCCPPGSAKAGSKVQEFRGTVGLFYVSIN